MGLSFGHMFAYLCLRHHCGVFARAWRLGDGVFPMRDAKWDCLELWVGAFSDATGCDGYIIRTESSICGCGDAFCEEELLHPQTRPWCPTGAAF